MVEKLIKSAPYTQIFENVRIKSIYKNTILLWFINRFNRNNRTYILEYVIHADAEKLKDLLST